jgi:2,3-bisphosphoglycerate-independent phosphoglycerate mutase
MSAREVTSELCARIASGVYDFALVNLANADMVGHTGVLPAAIAAVKVLDECIGRLAAACERAGWVMVITADHGNAEKMLEEDGVSPHTAHTANPVPLIVTSRGLELRGGGELADLVPTALGLLGLEKPLQMTGQNITLAGKRLAS